MLRSLFVLALAMYMLGCVSAVPYTPVPSRVAEPQEELEACIHRYWEEQPVDVSFKSGLAVIRFAVGSGGEQSWSSVNLVYADMHAIGIFPWQGGYGVRVDDAGGTQILAIMTPSLEAAKHVADVLAALTMPLGALVGDHL